MSYGVGVKQVAELNVQPEWELAAKVFGSVTKASEWMNSHHPIFGERTPAELCQTEAGRQRVTEVLGEILYSLF